MNQILCRFNSYSTCLDKISILLVVHTNKVVISILLVVPLEYSLSSYHFNPLSIINILMSASTRVLLKFILHLCGVDWRLHRSPIRILSCLVFNNGQKRIAQAESSQELRPRQYLQIYGTEQRTVIGQINRPTAK